MPIMKYIPLLILLVLSGCLARNTVDIRNPELHKIQNIKIIDSIVTQATTGDWLLPRQSPMYQYIMLRGSSSLR
jgi:hypothetical protein